MKSDYFQIRISEDEKREIVEAARLEDIPAAQLVRACLKKRAAQIKRKHEAKQERAAQPATA